MTRTWSEWLEHTAGEPCPIWLAKAGEYGYVAENMPHRPNHRLTVETSSVNAIDLKWEHITHYRYLLPEPAETVTSNLVQSKICAEIMEIMSEYDEQALSDDGIDCPGGLEHMGDVWRQLEDWRGRIIISQNSQHARQEDER